MDLVVLPTLLKNYRERVFRDDRKLCEGPMERREQTEREMGGDGRWRRGGAERGASGEELRLLHRPGCLVRSILVCRFTSLNSRAAS